MTAYPDTPASTPPQVCPKDKACPSKSGTPIDCPYTWSCGWNAALRQRGQKGTFTPKPKGHDEPCLICGEMCSSFAGNPGLWPVRLGNSGWYHVGCILDRLALLDSAQSALEYEKGNTAEAITQINKTLLENQQLRSALAAIERKVESLTIKDPREQAMRETIHGQGLSMAAMNKELHKKDEQIKQLKAETQTLRNYGINLEDKIIQLREASQMLVDAHDKIRTDTSERLYHLRTVLENLSCPKS